MVRARQWCGADTGRDRACATTTTARDNHYDATASHNTGTVVVTYRTCRGVVPVIREPCLSELPLQLLYCVHGQLHLTPTTPSEMDGLGRPVPPSTPRLVLYTGPSSWNLARIHAEYSVVCLEGDVVFCDKTKWYAIALEIDGKRVPFHSSERIHMMVRGRVCYLASQGCVRSTR